MWIHRFVPAFVHDLVGYRTKDKELHAMLCVIEASIISEPQDWILTDFRGRDSRFPSWHTSKWRGLINQKKLIVVRGDSSYYWPGVFIGNPLSPTLCWETISFGGAWTWRIDRVVAYHKRLLEQREAAEKAKSDRIKKQKQIEEAASVVQRFKPCLTSTEQSLQQVRLSGQDISTKTGKSSGNICELSENITSVGTTNEISYVSWPLN